MDTPNPHPSAAARLKALLTTAGLKSVRLDATRRALLCGGRSREWLIVVRLDDHWFHAYTVVCSVPHENGLRGRLFEEALRANAKMLMTKFSVADEVILELEYRAEHVDAAVLGDLTGYLHGIAEQYYPKIFRIVSGDETLEVLAGSLQGPEAAA